MVPTRSTSTKAHLAERHAAAEKAWGIEQQTLCEKQRVLENTVSELRKTVRSNEERMTMQGEFQHTAAEIRQECRDLVAKAQDDAKAAVKAARELASDKNKKLQRWRKKK